MAAVIQVPAKSQSELLTAWENVLGSRLFTVAEYQQMAELGIIGEDERVELIEGRIVPMPAENMLHAVATTRANRPFNKLLADRASVRVQDPILLNGRSEPEPDIVLVTPNDDLYLDNHPTPKDIFVILEIADTSLAYDRDVRCPLFARNGVVQFCILNVQDREMEDYRDPGPNGYRSKQTYGENESFNLVAFPKVSVKVKELPPPVKSTTKQRKK